jgi:hypothetical protein
MSLKPKKQKGMSNRQRKEAMSYTGDAKQIPLAVKSPHSKEMKSWLELNRSELPAGWGDALSKEPPTVYINGKNVLVTEELKMAQLTHEIAHKLILAEKKRNFTYKELLSGDEPRIWLTKHSADDKHIDYTIHFWEGEIENYDLWDSESARDFLKPIIRDVFPIPKDYKDAKLDDYVLEYADFRIDARFDEIGDDESGPEGLNVRVTARNPLADDRKHIMKEYVDSYVEFCELEEGKNDPISVDARKWRASLKKKWKME